MPVQAGSVAHTLGRGWGGALFVRRYRLVQQRPYFLTSAFVCPPSFAQSVPQLCCRRGQEFRLQGIQQR